jgi:hypothetical protein
MKDPIVEEVRKVRDAHASSFNFDLRAICRDLREKVKTCGHPLISLDPKPFLKATGS